MSEWLLCSRCVLLYRVGPALKQSLGVCMCFRAQVSWMTLTMARFYSSSQLTMRTVVKCHINYMCFSGRMRENISSENVPKMFGYIKSSVQTQHVWLILNVWLSIDVRTQKENIFEGFCLVFVSVCVCERICSHSHMWSGCGHGN